MNISYSQLKRIQSSKRNSLFILDFIDKDDSYEFKITGSTLNVYNISISKKYKNIKCNCPDSTSWAKYSNCVCKHCCFLLIKVLKLTEENLLYFFNNLNFSLEEFNKLVENLNKLSLNSIILEAKDEDIDDIDSPPQNPQYIDKQLIDKFKELKSINPKKIFEIKEINLETKDCPICYEKLEDKLLKCPDCRQVLHKVCMELWLKSGNHNCPYCRSESWKNYTNNSLNSYINLL